MVRIINFLYSVIITISLRTSAWLCNSILTVSTSIIIIKETICVPTSQVLGNWYYECLWMSPWGTPDWATLKKNLFINNEALRATSQETYTKLPVSSGPDLYRRCCGWSPYCTSAFPHILLPTLHSLLIPTSHPLHFSPKTSSPNF